MPAAAPCWSAGRSRRAAGDGLQRVEALRGGDHRREHLAAFVADGRRPRHRVRGQAGQAPRHRSLSRSQSELQIAVSCLERWSAVNGLQFSTAKTVAVHFCRHRRSCPSIDVKLYGEMIPVQTEAKFLGVVMDSRLTYKSHMKNLRDR